MTRLLVRKITRKNRQGRVYKMRAEILTKWHRESPYAISQELGKDGLLAPVDSELAPELVHGERKKKGFEDHGESATQ